MGPAVLRDDFHLRKVNIIVPMGIILPFMVAQLYIGTSIDILFIAFCAYIIPFLFLHINGRDLFSILAATYSLRYVGIAIIAKTFYGQALEENLYFPVEAYTLTLELMIVTCLALLIVRSVSATSGRYPFPPEPQVLRRISNVGLVIGFIGLAIVSTNKSRVAGEASSGPLFIIAAAMMTVLYLSVICETLKGILESNGRGFITPRLILIYIVIIPFVIFMNTREFLLSSFIGVGITAFMYNAIKWRHILLVTVLAYFFMHIFTPITLYLRMGKEGLSTPQYIEFINNTMTRLVSEDGFYDMIVESVEAAGKFNAASAKADAVQYDYYGDQSNVLNRLSYVALVDAVNTQMSYRVPMGMEVVKQDLIRILPSFIIARDNDVNAVGMGDWLNWQIGLATPGRAYFSSFALPMEGLVTWGLAGFLGYQFFFMGLYLSACSTISTFRVPLPASIYVYTATQHMFIEGAVSTLGAMMMRSLLFVAILIYLIYMYAYSKNIQYEKLMQT